MAYLKHLIPSTEAHKKCKTAYDALEKQRRVAWAKYYEQLGLEADRAYIIVEFANVGKDDNKDNRPETIPKHITDEMYEMACELRKKYECPCCLEQVNKETIKISYCGHIYCKDCFEEVKKQNDPKCAICRNKL